MSSGKIAVAATAVACMTLLSVGWSDQGGVSLSVATAQARVSHTDASKHMTSKHVAVGSRRHYRRAARGYGPNPVAAGAGLAAGAIGTAGAVAAGAANTAGAIVGAATSPFGAYASEPGWDGGYYASSPWGDYDCRAPSAYECRPYASKDWYHH